MLFRSLEHLLRAEDDGKFFPAPKMPQKLPIILSPEEMLEFLGCVRLHNHRTILTCCYAAGLRISEAIAPQAAHIDSQRMVIRVEQGKGRKDRYVMLSPTTYRKCRTQSPGSAVFI